ncbi:MAG: RNA 3'-terminal phosphate cyclase [Promethearchaeota archaeon]|nr:MAG: RNA 3'-terminal phosphate cyclase [Candidatus Lokiarchaeota archaeon]
MNKENGFLVIDGSMLEGGGSILRLSAGFSLLYNQPIKICNIRGNRDPPGLKTQHKLGLETLAELTGSKLSKCEIGTREITFSPKYDLKDSVRVDINTAASIGLLIQPIQIAALGFPNDKKITLNLVGGGTFGKWAPSVNYLREVTYKLFEKVGLKINVNIKRHGFYPKGGALLEYTVFGPKKDLNPINIANLGNIDKIKGEIICTKSLDHADVAERIKNSAVNQIRSEINIETDFSYKYVKSFSTGVGLSLWAESNTGAVISSGTIIGERGVPSEEVGKNAANELLRYIKNEIPVDNYLSDQLIPIMCYIGESKIKVLEITSHAKTNLELLKKFTDREYSIQNHDSYSIIKYF